MSDDDLAALKKSLFQRTVKTLTDPRERANIEAVEAEWVDEQSKASYTRTFLTLPVPDALKGVLPDRLVVAEVLQADAVVELSTEIDRLKNGNTSANSSDSQLH